MNADKNNKYPGLIRFRPWLVLMFVCVALCGFSAPVDYKQVILTNGTNFVRARLPLTDVSGKVRVKVETRDGFGLAVAPSKTVLDAKHYLEWQIGYDVPNTNSPTIVPQVKFTRKGETKYGHELSKILFDGVRLGFLSTNELAHEIQLLEKYSSGTFEESRAVEVEISTNKTADGFQSSVQKVPQFTKITPYGAVQVQLKPKQRAVGYQAMIYVCVPMNQVLTMDGTPRASSPAKSKETVLYEFNAKNADFLMDIVHAFGMASKQHNEDIRNILWKILEASAKS